jgi:hypothetical protein
MRTEAERLIKQAERDLINAKKNVEIEAYEVAAFLAEQAVEKFLKGEGTPTRAIARELSVRPASSVSHQSNHLRPKT